jgi:hypothetical protein
MLMRRSRTEQEIDVREGTIADSCAMGDGSRAHVVPLALFVRDEAGNILTPN